MGLNRASSVQLPVSLFSVGRVAPRAPKAWYIAELSYRRATERRALPMREGGIEGRVQALPGGGKIGIRSGR